MAEAFGVDVRTIRRWESEGLACRPEGRSKLYSLAHAISFYASQEVARAVRSAETSEMDALRTRKLAAETAAKEIELAKLRGELIPVGEIDTLLRESLEAVDSVVRGVPSRFASQLAKAAKIKLPEAKKLLADAMELVRGLIRNRGDPEDKKGRASRVA